MKSVIAVLAAVGVVSTTACASDPASNIDATIEGGLSANMVGVRIEKGVRATQAAPDIATDHFDRGQTYLELREYEKAIQEYDKVIQLDPDRVSAYNNRAYNNRAYNNRGIAYGNLDEYQRAIYDKAIQLDLSYAGAYNNRGYAYMKLGEYQRAIKDYDKAIQLDPNYAGAYNNRGMVYGYLSTPGYHSQYQRAIQDYDKAIQLDPNDARAYYNRGYAYRQLGEYQRAINDARAYFKRAIQDYDKAIQLDPNYVRAYFNRGLAYRDMGQSQRVIQDFDKACSLDKEYCDHPPREGGLTAPP